MAYTRAAVASFVMLAFGNLIGLHGQASAGSIVQTASYQFAPHGTTFDFYQQFDPALGELLQVEISNSGSATNGQLVLINATDADQAFTLSWSFSLNTDGGVMDVSGTLTGTLKPGESGSVTPGTDYDLSMSYTDTQFWIGTGSLGAQQFAASQGPGLIGPIAWTIDNANIFVDSRDGFSMDGAETITYTFLTIPEPSACIMLGTASLALAGVRSVRRNRVRTVGRSRA